ncbi:MAG: hypothetical protein V7607_195 [Solirubrobacteraceae bacterium]
MSAAARASGDRRVALVTGGAQGIGRACAQRLAREGCHVVIADRDPAGEAVAEIDRVGGSAAYEICDLAAPAAIERLAAGILERLGRCDVLVNNAAHLIRRPLSELDLDTWRRILAVNVDAAYLLCRALVPAMIQRGFGRVVNVISNTVWQPPPVGLLGYVTSKGAMLGFTRALAVEVGDRGVTVNAVAPGLTRTTSAQDDLSEEHFAAVRDQQAIKRSLQPDDIAGTIAFLASDDAALITGQAIRVDGGFVTL